MKIKLIDETEVKEEPIPQPEKIESKAESKKEKVESFPNPEIVPNKGNSVGVIALIVVIIVLIIGAITFFVYGKKKEN